MEDRVKYLVWLSLVPGIGAVKINKLLEFYKEPEAIWKDSTNGLKRLPFLNINDINRICDKKYKEILNIKIDEIYRNNIRPISIYDEEYPDNLKNIYAPPSILYCKGTMLKNEKYIAIVGSRKATSYGNNMSEVIAKELSKLGFTVVSGMARGIDSIAHWATLNNGGRTIAVLGCGLDTVYPRENKKLMEKISESGMVISEYLPGIPPLAQNFPARNRIISGMSLGVIVIEAGEKSGSLITANFALEQGREVFAVPGNLMNRKSIGTNKLIREGAKIITSIEDIIEEIRDFDYPEKLNKILSGYEQRLDKVKQNLDGVEIKIVESLEDEELHIDLIAQKTGLDIKILSSRLIRLELSGVIEQQPGKVFRVKIT